jgi:hypothetical protein
MSRTKECHGEFQIKSKKEEVQLLPLSSNRTKLIPIEMTIQLPPTLKGNILIVDDHLLLYKNKKCDYKIQSKES